MKTVLAWLGNVTICVLLSWWAIEHRDAEAWFAGFFIAAVFCVIAFFINAEENQ